MADIILKQGYVFIYPTGNASNLFINNLDPAQWGTVLKVNDLCESYVAGDTVFFNYENAPLIQQTGKEGANAYYLVREEDISFKQNV